MIKILKIQNCLVYFKNLYQSFWNCKSLWFSLNILFKIAHKILCFSPDVKVSKKLFWNPNEIARFFCIKRSLDITKTQTFLILKFSYDLKNSL